uniref:SLIT-ROBO Rho GTPase-activating protein 1-like isoform X2 n=1 Tax=Myxine glutinosa TaxID=7769 RepID=UPI00358F0A89
MTSALFKHPGRDSLAGYETHIKEVRVQFADRLHAIEQQTENRLHLLQEVQEFLKRRAELEADYARNLDRLVDRFYGRLRANTSEQVQALPATCWQLMLSQVRREGRDHAKLGELYSSDVVLRLAQLVDDTNRLSRKSKDMMAQVQEELNKSLQELCTNMRTYHSYHMESQGAENRLRGSERQLSAQPGASGLRKLQRNRDKWHEKYSDNKLRTSKARNEYLLSLCSVNAALDQCYGIDLQHVADLCNLGFYACLTRTFRTYLSAEYGLNESRNQSLDLLENGVNELETGAHRARFLESTFAGNTNSIAPPVFLFQTHTGDEVCQITAQEPIQGELVTRYEGIKQRLTGLRTENEEVKKTMDASLQYLQNLVNTDDYNVSSLFQDLDPEGSPVASPPEPFGGKASLESRHKQLETETFFLEKFKAFMATSNVITKLQAKQELIQKTLGEDESSSSSSTRYLFSWPPSIPPKPTKCKRLRPCSRVPISLFCGDLDSYIKVFPPQVCQSLSLETQTDVRGWIYLKFETSFSCLFLPDFESH